MRLSLYKAVAALSISSSAVASPLENLTSYCNPSRPASGNELRGIFYDYVEEFYFQRDFAGATNKYVALNLIQHNPQIANGSAAQIAAVTSILANYDGPNFELALVDEERGYGIVFNQFIGKPGTGLPLSAVVDIWRFEGTCIVEHWDAIEALPPNSTNPVPFKL